MRTLRERLTACGLEPMTLEEFKEGNVMVLMGMYEKLDLDIPFESFVKSKYAEYMLNMDKEI